MRIPFVKMQGAGNDFVVVDHRAAFLPAEPAALFASLCDRRRGIGADGVLLLETDGELDFGMRYHNSDGGRADWCGNGARCIARFALDLGLGRDGQVDFSTGAGPQRGRRLGDGRIAVEFGVVAPGGPLALDAHGRRFEGWQVTAGVPHFVVPVPEVAAVPLAEWAPALRRHERFGAAGTNVDFVARGADGRVAMRTYERGVEGETLACGSGAIATAMWAAAHGAASPVGVRTAGGDVLEIGFSDGPRGRSVVLTGPAEVSYTGIWEH